MPREQLLIVGGVAAGMSAASRARRRNPELDITVIEKGQHVSYGACGLPFYISGEVRDANELIVYSADFFREKRNIDVRLGVEAKEIDPGHRRVLGVERDSQPVVISYDKLVIATGAAAEDGGIPGADLSGVFTIGDLAGAIQLREFLEARKPRRAAIVGTGYIGLEMADALKKRGMEVTMIGKSSNIAEGFEPEICARVEKEFLAHGVRVVKNSAVRMISRGPQGEIQVHHGDTSEEADVVVLATGIRPRSAIADAAGIPLGASGAIRVDDRMQTELPGIYAAGDCAETRHMVSGKAVYFPLGTTANKQGRVAGENAAGGNARFEGIVGTLGTFAFGLEIARTGLTSAEARAAGFDPASVTIRTVSRAKYLGGRALVATLLWDRASGRLLGFQIAGEEGAAKRIDAAAVALHARMRIQEMAYLDLCYAPGFAPVWEALLVAAGEANKKSRRN